MSLDDKAVRLRCLELSLGHSSLQRDDWRTRAAAYYEFVTGHPAPSDGAAPVDAREQTAGGAPTRKDGPAARRRTPRTPKGAQS